jgi:serine protease Do
MPGDSGGPLFDLQGKVIGVHSRIGGALTQNIHVPVSAYQENWERMVKGDLWGRDVEPYLGVQPDLTVKTAKIAQITRNTPAQRAGLIAGDEIIRFNGKEISTFEKLKEVVGGTSVGQVVELTVQREAEKVNLKITIGRRPEL